MTQRALSVRAAVSYSLLRKVERGERAASHSFVAAVARAMSINITDLAEQAHLARRAGPATEQSGVPALRQALVEGDDPQLDTGPRPVEDLRADLARIKDWDRRTRHAEAVQALPDGGGFGSGFAAVLVGARRVVRAGLSSCVPGCRGRGRHG